MPNNILSIRAKYEAAKAEVQEVTSLLQSAPVDGDVTGHFNRIRKQALQHKVALYELVLQAWGDKVSDISDATFALITKFEAQIDRLHLDVNECSNVTWVSLSQLHSNAQDLHFKRAIAAALKVCRNSLNLQQCGSELTRQKIMHEVGVESMLFHEASLREEVVRLKDYALVAIAVADGTFMVKPFAHRSDFSPHYTPSLEWFSQMAELHGYMSHEDGTAIVDGYALKVLQQSQAVRQTQPAPVREPSRMERLKQGVRYYLGMS